MTVPISTDLYLLTMAQAYLHSGKGADRAVFHLFFRRMPFAGGYALAAGLETVLELLDHYRFRDEDLAYLASVTGSDGKRLFADAFLAALRSLELDLEIAAIPEGSLVFANEPLVRVSGRLWHAQLLETSLLNIVGFQTLVATKASRIVHAARGGEVLEFGARRAQADAALAASRAAHIGGCHATSHVLAGQRFGIPVRGTHAHSWVMAFESELEAFEAYVEAASNNSVLLVDTYDTLNGVRNAIRAGQKLRARGLHLQGIRLDSGDLAWLSVQARKLLDEAGFHDTKILASNELDEHVIESLIQQGAAISAWGVGTKLVTAYDEPALGVVYKLAMIERGGPGNPYAPRIKLSEQAAKLSNPGVQQVRRFSTDGRLVADVIYDETQGSGSAHWMIDPLDPTRQRVLGSHYTHEDLLVPVWRNGSRLRPTQDLPQIRAHARQQLARLDPTVQRLLNPHEYPVGLSRELYAERLRLVHEARNLPPKTPEELV